METLKPTDLVFVLTHLTGCLGSAAVLPTLAAQGLDPEAAAERANAYGSALAGVLCRDMLRELAAMYGFTLEDLAAGVEAAQAHRDTEPPPAGVPADELPSSAFHGGRVEPLTGHGKPCDAEIPS